MSFGMCLLILTKLDVFLLQLLYRLEQLLVLCDEVVELALRFVETPLQQLFLVVLLLMLALDFGDLSEELLFLLD